jgi:hypothetical protein
MPLSHFLDMKKTKNQIVNSMLKYLKTSSCSGLIKHVAYGVSISMIASNLHINEHRFSKEESNKIFSKKDSGLV